MNPVLSLQVADAKALEARLTAAANLCRGRLLRPRRKRRR